MAKFFKKCIENWLSKVKKSLFDVFESSEKLPSVYEHGLLWILLNPCVLIPEYNQFYNLYFETISINLATTSRYCLSKEWDSWGEMSEIGPNLPIIWQNVHISWFAKPNYWEPQAQRGGGSCQNIYGCTFFVTVSSVMCFIGN